MCAEGKEHTEGDSMQKSSHTRQDNNIYACDHKICVFTSHSEQQSIGRQAHATDKLTL